MKVTEAGLLARRRNALLGGKPKGVYGKHTMDVMEARKWLIANVIKNIEPLFQVLLKKSLEGDMVAMKELFDRSFGKSMQPINLGDKDGNPIVFMPLELIQKHSLTVIEGKDVTPQLSEPVNNEISNNG